MKISHYSFGRITVGGKAYSSDIIIYPNSVNSSWWRREGHLLQKEDIEDILVTPVSIVIIGTGFYGAMKVPDETRDYLEAKNIQLHICITSEAVKLYNDLSEKKDVTAALHLTC